MTRRTGWLLVLCGWECYLLALVCPAIHFGSVGIDGYTENVRIGARCLLDTFDPMNCLFAPMLLVYAIANVAMAGSVLLAAGSADTRCVGGTLMLFWFCVTLTAPWCASEVQGVLPGCVLWQLSFLLVGIGLIRLADSDRDGWLASWISRP
jgi:hypothetical protein